MFSLATTAEFLVKRHFHIGGSVRVWTSSCLNELVDAVRFPVVGSHYTSHGMMSRLTSIKTAIPILLLLSAHRLSATMKKSVAVRESSVNEETFVFQEGNPSTLSAKAFYAIPLDDSVIIAMRVNEILDRAIFADLAQDEEKMRKCADAFGIDQSDQATFPHQREMAKLLGAWRQAKTQREVKLTVDAIAKAHGEPVSVLTMDWNSLMTQFKSKYGADLCEEDLPAQSYFEEFEERLAEGNFEAERLSEVVSQEEADAQGRAKPDPARQYGMHLDGRLTLQTRRRFTSTEPRDIEQLRAKYTVMENLWLLGQMRQPGRSIYSDLAQNTFPSLLKTLLNKRNFNYKQGLTVSYSPNRAGHTACRMNLNSEKRHTESAVRHRLGLLLL